MRVLLGQSRVKPRGLCRNKLGLPKGPHYLNGGRTVFSDLIASIVTCSKGLILLSRESFTQYVLPFPLFSVSPNVITRKE